MSTQYLRELVQHAQVEMPLLNNDLQNASTLYALQAATQRMYNLMGYMLHHMIHAAYEANAGQPMPAPAPAPVPVPAPAPAPATMPMTYGVGGLPSLPPPNMISQPVPTAPTIPGMPDITVQPGVANVIITPQGTRVIAPSGAATVVPQGQAVDLAATSGHVEVPQAPPGVANIVLPPGGGLTPEALAALENRTTPTT